MKIVADTHIPYVQDYFGSYGDLICIPGRQISHADVKEADILLVRSITQVNKALLANTKVQFVGSVTAGKDHIDSDFLQTAGIAFSEASGFNAPPVADYVVSVIAALQKKQLFIPQQKRAAVIGVGQVGSLVAKHLQCLGMEVIYCDPVRAQAEKNLVSVDIQDIADVDLITVHVPLTRAGEHMTHHLLDKHFFSRQQKTCVLINASRGAVIHSVDLLQYGQHLLCCLDVFAHEPHIEKQLLQQAVIATPHIAGYSVQSKMRGIELIYQAACAKKIITPTLVSAREMPHQQLAFSGQQLHWQDIILGIFDPLLMTTMMRSLLLPADQVGKLFDQLRNQFNYRHEFAFTKVQAEVHEADKPLLQQLGIQILSP